MHQWRPEAPVPSLSQATPQGPERGRTRRAVGVSGSWGFLGVGHMGTSCCATSEPGWPSLPEGTFQPRAHHGSLGHLLGPAASLALVSLCSHTHAGFSLEKYKEGTGSLNQLWPHD